MLQAAVANLMPEDINYKKYCKSKTTFSLIKIGSKFSGWGGDQMIQTNNIYKKNQEFTEYHQNHQLKRTWSIQNFAFLGWQNQKFKIGTEFEWKLIWN